VSAREEILGRVREALRGDRTEPSDGTEPLDGTEPSEVHVPRGYRQRGPQPDLLGRFVERVEDYRATVTRCDEDDLVATVTGLLPAGGRVLLPAELPWPVEGTVDDGFSALELDGFDAVVTAATVAIAETGTIVLTHGPAEGRRALSLVPDVHVCVVRADQVVADVPAAVRSLDPARPQTWISGPSATSDIELDRVEGVHGPRTLRVVLVSDYQGM
jgi:L-lactate dehydrogenase complex protein LldG